MVPIFEISGTRFSISSNPSPYASSYGMYTIGDELLRRVLTRFARSPIEVVSFPCSTPVRGTRRLSLRLHNTNDLSLWDPARGRPFLKTLLGSICRKPRKLRRQPPSSSFSKRAPRLSPFL